MTYYAIGNHYASGTGRGFLNTEFVRTFATKEARQQWLDNSPKAMRACTKKQAIDAIVGNSICVGDTCTRREAELEIAEFNEFYA